MNPNRSLLLRIIGISALCFVLAGLAYSVSPLAKLANLDLTESKFQKMHIMLSKDEPGKCALVNRRNSTMRRSDNQTPGQSMNYQRLKSKQSDLSTWYLYSKNKGSVFFIPVSDVSDWTYPALYEFARRKFQYLGLPRIEWVQLHVNRVYQGLFLSIGMPFDLRKRDGGKELKRELISVQGKTVIPVDTRLREKTPLYDRSIALTETLKLDTQYKVLTWLSSICPTKETLFVLSNHKPYTHTFMPLPLSLSHYLELLKQRNPRSFEDSRFQTWVYEKNYEDLELKDIFSKEQVAEVELFLEQYKANLKTAMKAHVSLHPTTAAWVRDANQKGVGAELNL